MALPTITEISRDIFAGAVTWTENKLDGDVMLSRATHRGVVIERRVDKRQGATYGDAVYRAALEGSSEWTLFDVANRDGTRRVTTEMSEGAVDDALARLQSDLDKYFDAKAAEIESKAARIRADLDKYFDAKASDLGSNAERIRAELDKYFEAKVNSKPSAKSNG